VRSALVVTATVVAWALGISAGLIAIGALISALGRGHYQTTIASALFIGGGALFVWNGFAGGTGRGRRADIIRSGTQAVAPTDALAWVAVGLLVIGAGVLAAIW